jgi:Tfp pilus assembly protein PilV
MLTAIRRRLRQEDGISLIEMMVALLIVGFVMFALTATMVTALASVRQNEGLTAAVALANEVIEDLHAMPYGWAVLEPADAAALPGVADNRFESQHLALVNEATSPHAQIPAAQQTVSRGGRSYTVRRYITWGEGVDSYKRFVVMVTWSEQGVDRVHRSEAYRTPGANDQSEVFIYIASVEPGTRTVPLDPAGYNSVPLTIRAFTVLPRASVLISYETRTPEGGRLVVERFMTPGPGGRAWSHTIASGQRMFPNGRVTFTVSTQPPSEDLGFEYVPATESIVFLHDLALAAPPAGGQPLAIEGGSGPIATCEGVIEQDLAVDLHIKGAWTITDDVNVSWTGPGAGQVLATPVDPTLEGYGYRAVVPAGTAFAGTSSFTVSMTRQRDNLSLPAGSGMSVEVNECPPPPQDPPVTGGPLDGGGEGDTQDATDAGEGTSP